MSKLVEILNLAFQLVLIIAQNYPNQNYQPRQSSAQFKMRLNPLNPKSDQHVISPYSNTAESFIKIMRRKEMITNPKSYDCETNSPCQYRRKCTEKSIENMDAGLRV